MSGSNTLARAGHSLVLPARGPFPSSAPVRTLAELLRRCERTGCDDVWLPAELLGWLRLPPRIGAGVTYGGSWLDGLEDAGWTSHTRGLAPHAYYYRRGGAGVNVNVPAWASRESGSPFAGLTRDELGAQVTRLRESTHGLVVWKGTATLTSDELIRRTTHGLVGSPLPDALTRHPPAELPHAWTAEPGSYEQGNPRLRAPRHCYAYDLNLAYLNGASSLALGCGRMVPAVWDSAAGPGWWLVSDDRGWRLDVLPAPLSAYSRDGSAWVTTPTAKALDAWGWRVHPDGWTFPESHRYLERWYKTLRDARAELLPRRGAAYDAVKQIAQHGLGRLGSLLRRQGDSDPLYQPYWRQAVIAEMRTRLLRRMMKLRRYPIAVDVDCCYFLTNSTTPEQFAEWCGIPLGEGLGQFKYAGRCTGRVAREALELRTNAALRMLREQVTV